MDNNNLLMIILAFVFGYCLQGMMKNMCGGQIIEYSKLEDPCVKCLRQADVSMGGCGACVSECVKEAEGNRPKYYNPTYTELCVAQA